MTVGIMVAPVGTLMAYAAAGAASAATLGWVMIGFTRVLRTAAIGLAGVAAAGLLSVVENAAPESYAAIPLAGFISVAGWVAGAFAVVRAVPILRRRIAAAEF